jgi:hypothetical protein
LSGGGKRLKKKKTSARKNTNDPVWNEAVAFSISADSLANAALEVCIYLYSIFIIFGYLFIAAMKYSIIPL